MKNKDLKPEKHPTGCEPGGTEPNCTRSGGALLGIRDSETGEYLKYDDGLPVTLRVEPTKPCEWCSGEHKVGGGFTLDYDYCQVKMRAENRRFCPNCGRSLK